MTEQTLRTRAGSEQRAILAAGRIEMQVCPDCGHVQYPPAELCRRCLGGELAFAPVDASATVIASALVHRSYRDDFADGGPWPIASVRLASGATVFTHVVELLEGNTPVTLVALTDKLGEGVFGAVRDAAETGVLRARFGAEK